MRDPDKPPFWQWFKDYLSFHKQERKNITVLVAFIFFLLAIQLYLNLTATDRNFEAAQFLGPDHFKSLNERVDSTESSKKLKDNQRWKRKEDRKSWIPMAFNPNELDSSGWRVIGLSAKQASVMLKIRDERGGFKSKRELKKTKDDLLHLS